MRSFIFFLACVLAGVPLIPQTRRPHVVTNTASNLQHITIGDQVPQNFKGHQLAAIVRALDASGHDRPKSEFETTAAYQSRGLRFLQHLPDLLILLKKAKGVAVSFDADQEEMTFAYETRQPVLRGQNGGDGVLEAVILNSELISSRRYVGTNAFGASVVVRQQNYRDQGLILQANSLTGPFTIKITPERAREIEPYAGLIIVCRVDDPIVYTGTEYSKATISDPEEEYRSGVFVHVVPNEVLIFDTRNGEILRRVSRSQAPDTELQLEQQVDRIKKDQKTTNRLGTQEIKQEALQKPQVIKPESAPPSLISNPPPTYPPLARQARIDGVVRFSATVSKQGTLENVILLSGHPLLVAAAQEAVGRWKYKPGMINGQAADWKITLDVPFSLE